ncbi:glycosyltransferase family 8 protein [Butyrivibrio fibrisolvens]|uniref:glycosyltransferase family 8 protein n=1 Tax=Butyrivibrio fibrisolvens TaxID=831 RepID=UPI0020BECFC5|nr:glycosyltransferase [Butyrivibrio fibrisolvens]
MKYNILYCSNEAYSPKLVCSLLSLLDSNQDILKEIHIFIRTNDFSDDTINRFYTIISEYGMDSKQLNVVFTDELESKLKDWHMKTFKGSYMCYYKLFGIDELLDGEYLDRILVIDADTLVLDSLKELYYTDLDGCPVGAVKEFPTEKNHHADGVVEYNTGVLLFDLEKYKRYNIEWLFREAVNRIDDREWYTGDQLVFAEALYEKKYIKKLDLKYNFIMNQLPFSYNEFCYYRDLKDGDYYNRNIYEVARSIPQLFISFQELLFFLPGCTKAEDG